MRKIISLIAGLFLVINIAHAEEKLSIEKQLVGIVGAISGKVKTENRELKAGDKIYLNETIYAAEGAGRISNYPMGLRCYGASFLFVIP